MDDFETDARQLAAAVSASFHEAAVAICVARQARSVPLDLAISALMSVIAGLVDQVPGSAVMAWDGIATAALEEACRARAASAPE